MFNTNYIAELLQGHLSEDGYKHFLHAVAVMIRRYKWPKAIIEVIEERQNRSWNKEEIEELTQQFFDWALTKGKFSHLFKIPESYLSYYFSTMIVSFVADKIKAQQGQLGLSFEKVS